MNMLHRRTCAEGRSRVCLYRQDRKVTKKSWWRLLSTNFPLQLSTDFPLQLRTYLGEMADGNEIVADLEKDGVKTGVGLVKSGAGKAVSGAFDVAKNESRKVVIKLTNNTQMLENVQKFALRICSKPWNSDYDTLLGTLNIPTLSNRRKTLKLCLLFNILAGTVAYPSCPITIKNSHSYHPQ